jgi:hypothetical protein
MKASDRKAIQDAGDAAIRKARKGHVYLLKGDTLNQRALKLGLATDMPFLNRASRRDNLKTAIHTERKARKRATA